MQRGRIVKLVMLLALLTPALCYSRHDGAYLNVLDLRLATPHEEWGRPCARGRLKVLFVTGHTGAPRDVAELAERFDMDVDCCICVGLVGQFGR